MFKRFASATAICSLVISTINKAEGKRVKSATEPKLVSNLARSREICNFSFLEILSTSRF